MNVRALLLILTLTAFYGPSVGADASLVGCHAAGTLTDALRKLNDRDWDELSEADLRSTWPPAMGSLDCDDSACQTLWHKGKVINGECKCCELFNFAIARDGRGAVTNQHLYSIVIYSSASDQNKTVEAARDFARALGAADSEASTISHKSRQRLYWTVGTGKQKKIALMEFQLAHGYEMWTAYIYFSRQPA